MDQAEAEAEAAIYHLLSLLVIVLEMGAQLQEVRHFFKCRHSVLRLPVVSCRIPPKTEEVLQIHRRRPLCLPSSPTTIAWSGLLAPCRRLIFSAAHRLQPFKFLRVLQVHSVHSVLGPLFIYYYCSAGVGLRLLLDSNNDLVVTGTAQSFWTI